MMGQRRAEPLPPEAIHVLQPFFPRFDLRQLRVREGLPRYVQLAGEAPLGYADRRTIYLQVGAFQPHTSTGLALLAHEITHCWQYAQLGTWRFRARYLAAYWRNRRRGLNHAAAYWQIPFEVEARAREALVLETLQEQEATALRWAALPNHLTEFHSDG